MNYGSLPGENFQVFLPLVVHNRFAIWVGDLGNNKSGPGGSDGGKNQVVELGFRHVNRLFLLQVSKFSSVKAYE